MSLMNRLGNAKNPYQGSSKRVLCLCSAGLLRSPTLASVLNREFDLNVRAAGVSQEYALVPVNQVLLYWADEVVCVEPEVLMALEDWMAKTNYLFVGQMVVLDLPDVYPYNDPALRKECLDQYVNATNPTATEA